MGPETSTGGSPGPRSNGSSATSRRIRLSDGRRAARSSSPPRPDHVACPPIRPRRAIRARRPPGDPHRGLVPRSALARGPAPARGRVPSTLVLIDGRTASRPVLDWLFLRAKPEGRRPDAARRRVHAPRSEAGRRTASAAGWELVETAGYRRSSAGSSPMGCPASTWEGKRVAGHAFAICAAERGSQRCSPDLSSRSACAGSVFARPAPACAGELRARGR